MAGHSEGRSGFFGNHYVRIYFLLLVLLAVSILGPVVGGTIDRQVEIFGHQISLGLALTLVTAFGIAVWKASLVIKHFMHLSIERPIAKIFLAASVLLLALFWGGVAPDVQLHEGRMWENLDAKAAVARGISEPEVHVEDDSHAAEGEHAEEVAHASLVPTHKSTDNLLPGGYNLAHAAFWSVLALVAVGNQRRCDHPVRRRADPDLRDAEPYPDRAPIGGAAGGEGDEAAGRGADPFAPGRGRRRGRD